MRWHLLVHFAAMVLILGGLIVWAFANGYPFMGAALIGGLLAVTGLWVSAVWSLHRSWVEHRELIEKIQRREEP